MGTLMRNSRTRMNTNLRKIAILPRKITWKRIPTFLHLSMFQASSNLTFFIYNYDSYPFNISGKKGSLIVKDCLFNIPEKIETLNKDLVDKIDIDCPTLVPQSKNTSDLAYIYRCCTRTECDMPTFNSDSISTAISSENDDELAEDVNNLPGAVHKVNPPLDDDISNESSVIKSAIPTIILISLIFFLKFLQ